MKMCPTSLEIRNDVKLIPYREAVRSLMYLMIGTRPDIAFAVSNVSKYMENPQYQQHLKSVMQIFRYVKGSMPFCIRYGCISESVPCNLEVFCDAN